MNKQDYLNGTDGERDYPNGFEKFRGHVKKKGGNKFRRKGNKPQRGHRETDWPSY